MYSDDLSGKAKDLTRTIQAVGKGDKTAVLARTLADAFQDDPALTWVIPDDAARRAALRPFFAIMAEQSSRHGTILASEAHEAASLWYPPGVIKDGFVDGLWDNLRLLRIFKGALPRGLKVAETMYAHHPSPQSYAYLRYVGVSPDAQGKGWGGAVIREGIARAAAAGQGVLLETATESNVAIYIRLGFEVVSEWRVPGGGPKFWTMIHPAP